MEFTLILPHHIRSCSYGPIFLILSSFKGSYTVIKNGQIQEKFLFIAYCFLGFAFYHPVVTANTDMVEYIDIFDNGVFIKM